MTQHYDCAGSVKEVMLNFTINLWDSLSQNAKILRRLKPEKSIQERAEVQQELRNTRVKSPPQELLNIIM